MPSVFSALIAHVVSHLRPHQSLRLENMALRHQLAVYQHTVKRPKLRPVDRLSGEAIISQPLEWCSPHQNSSYPSLSRCSTKSRSRRNCNIGCSPMGWWGARKAPNCKRGMIRSPGWCCGGSTPQSMVQRPSPSSTIPPMTDRVTTDVLYQICPPGVGVGLPDAPRTGCDPQKRA